MISSLPGLLLAAAAATTAPLPKPQSLATVTIHAPAAALRVQVANTEPERERGLMSVTALEPHNGMVFVFDSDAPVAFWMKDTLIPLDMVFVGADGIVRKVYANVKVVSPQMPDEQIPREEGSAKYVIELAAGEAQSDGLKSGARVRDLPK